MVSEPSVWVMATSPRKTMNQIRMPMMVTILNENVPNIITLRMIVVAGADSGSRLGHQASRLGPESEYLPWNSGRLLIQGFRVLPVRAYQRFRRACWWPAMNQLSRRPVRWALVRMAGSPRVDRCHPAGQQSAVSSQWVRKFGKMLARIADLLYGVLGNDPEPGIKLLLPWDWQGSSGPVEPVWPLWSIAWGRWNL